MIHQPTRDTDKFEPPRDDEPVDVLVEALDKETSVDEPMLWEPRLRVKLDDRGMKQGRTNAALRAADARGHICHMNFEVVNCKNEDYIRQAVIELANLDEPPRRMIGTLNERLL